MAKDPSKTEKATPRRRQKAREEGQVARSQDIPIATTLFILFIAFLFYLPFAYKYIIGYLKYSFANSFVISTEMFSNFLLFSLKVMAILLAPILIILFLTGIISNVAQFGFLFTTKPLTPKFDRFNIISGLKRIFSLHTAFETVRNLLKLSVAFVISYFLINFLLEGIFRTGFIPVEGQMLLMIKYILIIIFTFAIFSIPIAIIDFAYRKWEYEESIKMTKQEVKEEIKSYEGNPIIKSAIKRKQRELALRRMMADVAKADVVITNPEHFAIALKYERGKDEAPKVVGKGIDNIAQKIKEVAKENNIPIIEDPPLARGLYESAEIGDYIPEKFYKAIAKIFAMLYKKKNIKV